MATQAYVNPSRLTLRRFLEDRWLPAVEQELRPSTYLSYERNLRKHVLPALGDVALQDLDPGLITALYRRLGNDGRKDHRTGSPLSPRTVRYIHTTLRSALQTAYEWDLIARNPADRAKPPRPSSTGDRHTKIQTWSRSELATFLERSRAAGDALHPLWLLLSMTGLRRGEALGLAWSAVDLPGARLSVRRSLVDVDKGQPAWSDPKTARGRRMVSLDPTTVEALMQLCSEQAELRHELGESYKTNDLVFAQEDGGPLHPDATSKIFRRLVRRHGLPPIRLHDLRHTWATLALELGVHPKVVQERLGHANVSITLDLYSHVSPAMESDAANRVAALVLDQSQNSCDQIVTTRP
jgi:integrase